VSGAGPLAAHRPPGDHPERRIAADEIHARPYVALETPERASHLAVMVEQQERDRERAHLVALCDRFGVAVPDPAVSHFSAAFGAFRLKWERHGEFSAYTVLVRGQSPRPFSEPALGFVPAEWLAAIPGQTIVAAHAKLVRAAAAPPDAATLADHFGGNVVVGAEIGEGAGMAFTDFRIRDDGFVRFLVLDRGFTPRQAGRMLQRLFEIEAYRVLALLALPIARREAPRVLEIERALEALTADIAREGGTDEQLLGELTRLAARVESAAAASRFRFGAARAYYDLVCARIGELRERRIPGLQTIDEFMGRRLAPAMATVDSVARRMADLSERVARASALLSTRVDIARERQNQALLASMDRRARLQLRLQQTVEGLSVAAITYYVVGLVGHAAKALKAAGAAVEPDPVTGLAIPIVAVLAALGVRHVRRRIVSAERGGAA
jgi:uncharacterized membrane-anchored protein